MSRKSLIDTWGPEIILLCSCHAHRSHFMNGNRAKCPKCGTEAKMIYGDSWEEIEAYLKR